MGRTSKNPRYKVVSLRISDSEREILDVIAARSCRSVSDVMREALRLVMEKRQVTP